MYHVRIEKLFLTRLQVFITVSLNTMPFLSDGFYRADRFSRAGQTSVPVLETTLWTV